jgi:hypothetical protein
VRGEGEEGEKGEESMTPPYTNEHSALASLNMISFHYAPSCIPRLRLFEE